MKNSVKIGIISGLVIGMVLISGCTRDNSKYCAETFPGDTYNATSNMCEKIITPTPQVVYVTVLVTSTPTPVTAKPTIPTPTPIPTLNKNSVAYQNYKDDLQYIEDLKTERAIVQSNYLKEMQNAGSDVAWARALTIEYNKLEAAYEIKLKAAQTRAAADLADAKGE
jgi:hypothetical protein